MFIKDIYVLKESDPFVVKEREGVTINLELVKVPPCFHTLLIGKVLCCYCPIKNATVLILDKDGSPRYRTTTDEYGIYRFRNILAPGIYHVIVSAVGYRTSFMKTVYVREFNISYLSFQMIHNSVYTNGVIYGGIQEYGNRIPIADVTVYLKSVGYGNEVIYKTMTNYDGHYLIYDVLPNYYMILIEKQGYQAANPRIIKVTKYDHIKCNFSMYRQWLN